MPAARRPTAGTVTMYSHDLVRLLPPAQEPDGPRGHRLHRGQHRGATPTSADARRCRSTAATRPSRPWSSPTARPPPTRACRRSRTGSRPPPERLRCTATPPPPSATDALADRVISRARRVAAAAASRRGHAVRVGRGRRAARTTAPRWPTLIARRLSRGRRARPPGCASDDFELPALAAAGATAPRDPDVLWDGWYDDGALRREVLDPLGAGRRGVPAPDALAADACATRLTDRSTRAELQRRARPGRSLVVDGRFLLRWELADAFDVVVHLETSPAALARRCPADDLARVAGLVGALPGRDRPGRARVVRRPARGPAPPRPRHHLRPARTIRRASRRTRRRQGFAETAGRGKGTTNRLELLTQDEVDEGPGGGRLLLDLGCHEGHLEDRRRTDQEQDQALLAGDQRRR